jgi:hypothetical protein
VIFSIDFLGSKTSGDIISIFMFTPNFEQELHKQLLLISEERDRLLSRTEQMSLAINELEVLKEVSNNKASQLLLIFISYKLSQ